MASGGSYISLFTHRHTERCRWEILPKMAAHEQSVLGPCLGRPTLQSKGSCSMASGGSYISLFTHRHTERCRWEILPKMAAHEQSVLGPCLGRPTLQSKGSCSMACGGSYISLFTHRHTGRCRWEILPKMAAHEQSVLGPCLGRPTLQSKGSCSMACGGSYISLFTHRHTGRCWGQVGMAAGRDSHLAYM